MKPAILSLRFATFVAILACAGCVQPGATSQEPVGLNVAVDVPVSWRPFLADDVADAFASRLADTFKREGYQGRIAHVTRLDTPEAGVPLLEIRLSEWRIDHAGSAQCTFTAALKTPTGETSLGLVNNSAIFWPVSSGRWSINRRYEMANALENAAENALRDLYAKLAQTNQVPGLEPRK